MDHGDSTEIFCFIHEDIDEMIPVVVVQQLEVEETSTCTQLLLKDWKQEKKQNKTKQKNSTGEKLNF